MTRDWLGDDFQPGSSEGLFARLNDAGELLGFGYVGRGTSLAVDIAARTATETHEYDEDVDFTDWLTDWRDQARAATRPYSATLNCAFCGKSNTEVKKLIAGPSSYICNECVELCSEILAEDTPST